MTIGELITQFRSRDDDNIQIGSRFSVLDIGKFLTDAIRYINDNHPCAVRIQYLTLTPKADSYSLPTDFVQSKFAIDLRRQKELAKTAEADTNRKSLGDVIAYCPVDQSNRRRLLFKQVPDLWYGVEYLVQSFASNTLSYYTFSIYDGQCHFDPTIIEITDGTNTEFLRASISDASTQSYVEFTSDTFTGTSGATTIVADTSTDMESYLKQGDSIRLGATDLYTISSVDGYTITLTSALSSDYSGESLYKNINIYSCYISERNITDDTQITIAAGQSMTLVDIYHNYICYPPNYFAMGAGTVTTSGTTVTGVGTAFTTAVSAGDFIQVGRTQYAEVASVTSDTELVLTSALKRDVATASNYYFVFASQTPAIPLDYHNYIVDFAKWYAYQAESRENEAADQYVICEQLLNKIHHEEDIDTVNKLNKNRPVTPWNTDPSWRNTNPGNGINSGVYNG